MPQNKATTRAEVRKAGRQWWHRPAVILAQQYAHDLPRETDEASIRRLVQWKRSLGFDTEHLWLNHSMMSGNEGGDDPKAFLFKNRHGFLDDYLGRYLPIAREHGLRVIVYFNCHWYRSGVFSDDCYVMDAQGRRAVLYGSGGGVCPRGGFRAWSRGMAEDLGRYPIAGVFLDGPVQQPCFCAACREAFHACFGEDLVGDSPRVREARPAFAAQGAAGYVQAFSEALAAVNPDAVLYFNDRALGGDGRVCAATATCTHLVGAEGGFVGYGPLDDRFPFSITAAAKVLEARSRGRGRVVFCDGGFKSFDYHAHPQSEVARMYAGCLANGASIWFMILRAAMDTAGMQAALRFNALIGAHREALGPDRSLAEIAVLHSPLNLALGAAEASARDDVGRQAVGEGRLRVSRHWAELRGLFAALSRSACPFDVIEEANLLEGPLPPRIKLVVLPGVAAMSDRTTAALRGFVDAGGTLLATFDASLFDEAGQRLANYALSDVFGAEVAGELLGPTTLDYVTAAPGDGWADLFTQPLVPCPEYRWPLRAFPGARVLARYCRQMPRRYAMPPAPGEYPMAVLHPFGRGKAILISAAIGDHLQRFGFPDHQRMLLQAVSDLAPSPVQIAGGHGLVEAMLRQSEDGTVTLHLTNWASGPRPAPRAIATGPLDIRLRLPAGFTPERIELAWAAQSVGVSVESGWASFRVPCLEEYELAVIRPASASTGRS